MGETELSVQDLRLDHRVLPPLRLNESRKPSPLVICAKAFTAPAQSAFMCASCILRVDIKRGGKKEQSIRLRALNPRFQTDTSKNTYDMKADTA